MMKYFLKKTLVSRYVLSSLRFRLANYARIISKKTSENRKSEDCIFQLGGIAKIYIS